MKANERILKQIKETEGSVQVANRLIALSMAMRDKETALMHAEAKGQMLMTCMVLQWVADDETELDLLPYVAEHIQAYSDKYSLEKFSQASDAEGGLGGFFEAMGFEKVEIKKDDADITTEASADDKILDFKKLLSKKLSKENSTNLN